MANFNKAFNFRGGFQVDTDVFIVRGQNVGIGSTIPNDRLVVDGKIVAKAVGVDSISILRSEVGILTVTESLDIGIESGSGLPFPLGAPQVRITTGIITAANPAIGFVTYYGDGGNLLNLPTSQWVDTDVGLGFTSIYAAGNVGVGTTDPRFTFQVGSTPVSGLSGFNSAPGVGIDSGSIWATNDIRIGGDVEIGGNIDIDGNIEIDGGITIGGTFPSSIDGNLSVGGFVSVGSTLYVAGIVTAQELAGIGSLITLINADNIAIGSIGSMRYGDIINTKEVYADRFIGTATSAEDLTPDAQITIDTIVADTVTANRFIGTATSAEDLTPDAQISIDTIEANTIDAIDRFTTVNGNIAVGHTDTGTIGDIDVRKTSSDSTIYSLTSTDSSARIFVGHERQVSANNGFGGLRFGGNISGSPISGPNDLDLVNYDVGNLNYYLHDGSAAGGTLGNFRWINGQLDIVLMELTSGGGLVLAGNGDITQPTLEVTTGFSTFKGAATFDSTVDILGNVSVGSDLTVAGELTFGSIVISGPLEVPSLLVSTEVVVGSDPSIGGTGVKLESSGSIAASNSLNIGSSVITTSGVSASNLNATTSNINGALSANSISSNSFSTPGSSINSAGDASFNLLTANSLNVGSFSIPSGTINSLTSTNINSAAANITDLISDTITAGSITSDSIDSTSGTFQTLLATVITPTTGTSVTITNLDTVAATINTLTSNTINVSGTTSTDILTATDTVTAGTIVSSLFSSDNSQSFIDFVVDGVNEELVINVYTAGPSLRGTITLPYVAIP